MLQPPGTAPFPPTAATPRTANTETADAPVVPPASARGSRCSARPAAAVVEWLGAAWTDGGPHRHTRPSRKPPAPPPASDSRGHTQGRSPRRSPRVGPSARPQVRRALAAGAVPIVVAGFAQPAVRVQRQLPTVRAGPQGRGRPATSPRSGWLGRAFAPMAAPVHLAHGAAPVAGPRPGRGGPSTDATGGRRHASPAATARAGARGRGCASRRSRCGSGRG
jgi:hypothetical protein